MPSCSKCAYYSVTSFKFCPKCGTKSDAEANPVSRPTTTPAKQAPAPAPAPAKQAPAPAPAKQAPAPAPAPTRQAQAPGPVPAPKQRRSVWDYVEERAQDENKAIEEKMKQTRQEQAQFYSDELRWRSKDALEEEKRRQEEFANRQFESKLSKRLDTSSSQPTVTQPQTPTTPEVPVPTPIYDESVPKPRRSVFDLVEEKSKDEENAKDAKKREIEKERQEFYQEELRWRSEEGLDQERKKKEEFLNKTFQTRIGQN